MHTTDAESGEVLMLGYMNADALQRTIATVKPIIGAEAANAFGTKARPAALFKKLSRCASTTTRMLRGYASRSRVQVPVVTLGIALVFIAPYLLGKPAIPPAAPVRGNEQVFDPADVYGDAPNPTQL